MALDSLETSPLLKGMWKYVVNEGKHIEINLYIRDKSLKFVTEVRNELRAKQVQKVLDLAREHENLMVVAGKIYADSKELLVEKGIAYIEANGNMFIQQSDLYIWVDTNKPKAVTKGVTNRAFTKTGLKVVFHFLMNEHFLNMSYRQIAELAGTSLGNVTNVINALKELEYIVKEGGEYKFRNKLQLAEKWMDVYEHELKPAIEIGTFSFQSELDYQNWKRVLLEPRKTIWSGEPGGHLLTGMLRPSKLIIYTLENRNDLMNHYRLQRNPEGYIKVYRKFWNYDDYRSNIAPPLLIYADLMNSGDAKNIEAADRIFDDVLKSKFS